MMGCTDRHCRFLFRLISPHALMYSEMVVTGALLHGDHERFLRHDVRESPCALQLGGSDPAALAACGTMAVDAGYDEVNLNVGCPSDRVQAAMIGACLMAHPKLVATAIEQLQEAVEVPVTVKTRIGIDEQDSYGFFSDFVGHLVDAGCDRIIVHARKAMLRASPKQNRSVPPLRYDYVYRIRNEYPGCHFILNGGITDVGGVDDALPRVDGIMVGRQVYHEPSFLAELEAHLFDHTAPSERQVVECYLDYVDNELRRGTYLKHMTKHLLGFFHGIPGAKAFRRHLSEKALVEGAGVETIQQALELVQD